MRLRFSLGLVLRICLERKQAIAQNCVYLIKGLCISLKDTKFSFYQISCPLLSCSRTHTPTPPLFRNTICKMVFVKKLFKVLSVPKIIRPFLLKGFRKRGLIFAHQRIALKMFQTKIMASSSCVYF